MTTRKLTTTTEPVTVAEVKTLIPLSGTDFDSRITALIPGFRAEAEQITARSLAVSTFQLKLDAFPAHEIRLLYPPLTTVDSIQYVDTAGVTQTMAGADYYVDEHSEPGWVLPAYGTEWPETYDTANAVTVNYTAGFGASAPSAVKLWIASRIRADIDGGEPGKFLDGMLDYLKVY